MLNLTNVSLYSRKNEVVCRKCSGLLDQKRSDKTFDTVLSLSGGDASKLAIGESYYAVGITEDKAPVKTEIVTCTAVGDTATLQSSILFPEKPADYVASSDADMFMQFTNYSSSQLARFSWGAKLEYGFGSLTNAPGPILAAQAGQQSMGASQILGWVAEGPADIWVTWTNYNTGKIFGTWIHFHVQVFRIGSEPIWLVTTDASNWQPSGSDPSFPYTWDFPAVGLDITGTPTSGHSSLSINVTIQDPS